MFSSRLPRSLEANPFTTLLAEKRAAGAMLIDLTLANPTQAGFAYPATLLAQPPGHGGCPSSPLAGQQIYRPTAQGALEAREAICRFYRTSRQQLIDPDNLFLTAGTSEAYSFLFKLLTNPGDEVLLPAPGYPLFDLLAELDLVTPCRYPLRRDGQGFWRLDFSHLRRQISRRTRAIVVVHPHNPTGSYLSEEEMRRLGQLCRDHQLALIIDEVFFDYPAAGGPANPVPAVAENTALTFVLNGFSKLLGLPQAKLSWIHLGGPPALRAGARERLEFIADSYLSVGTVQHQAAELLAGYRPAQEEIRQRLASNDAALAAATGLKALPREGGWYRIIQLPPGWDDESCCLELLKRHNLIVHPGFFYDFLDEAVLVVSLLCPEADFRRGLELLQEFLPAPLQ